MILSSDRLYVRRYTLADEEAFFRLNGDEEIMRFIRPAKSREDSKAFLIENLQFYETHPGLGRWALLEKGSDEFVGTFSLLPLAHTDDVHIGYALLKEHWGKGYAAEIVGAGVKYVFDVLKLLTVVAVTYEANVPSQKVLTKNGFVKDGVYGGVEKNDLLFRLNRD
jgi:[ribosomal protein S5]-alanine N-acetyltransferase